MLLCIVTPLRSVYIINVRSVVAGKGSSNAAMAAEMQRVAEAQRQYLLDMIPGQHARNPWTKN